MEISSSIIPLSLVLWSGRQSCKERVILKMQSAGCRGNFPSIVNLLRVVQIAQHWAAKKVHTALWALWLRESRIENQSTLRRWRRVLHFFWNQSAVHTMGRLIRTSSWSFCVFIPHPSFRFLLTADVS
jgi:hypothetical protein